MDKKRAIDILANATFSDDWQGDEELTTAYRMALDALENSDKYINRFDAVIELSCALEQCTLPQIKECLDKMPTLFTNVNYKELMREV